MDISFKTEFGRFNYRVCAVIISDEKLLAMKDERSPYYYLPGGRVKLHETAENAIIRELNEELNISAKIIRALWLNQNFFIEDVDTEKYHELCLYYLMDISETELLNRGNDFLSYEGNKKLLFRWIKFDDIESSYLYPLFIKKKIFEIPNSLEILTEIKE